MQQLFSSFLLNEICLLQEAKKVKMRQWQKKAFVKERSKKKTLVFNEKQYHELIANQKLCLKEVLQANIPLQIHIADYHSMFILLFVNVSQRNAWRSALSTPSAHSRIVTRIHKRRFNEIILCSKEENSKSNKRGERERWRSFWLPKALM